MLYYEVVNTNYVDAIKNKEHILRMKKALMKKSYRDYLMFVMGINSGLKVCDLLSLKFEDVLNNGQVKEFIKVHNKMYLINESMSIAISEYYVSLDSQDESRYLFEKGYRKNPIGRSHAYRILNNVGKEIGLKEKIGMHTLRKTYGYHYYIEIGDLKYLQKLFNHSAPSITMKYIGVTNDKDNDLEKINFEL